jgi:hypothetical protein
MKDEFINKLESFSKELLLKKAKEVPDLSNNVIYKHYAYLLEFTKTNTYNKSLIELIGLIHMCYGWMPTMFKKSDVSLYNDKIFVNNIWENINNGSIENDFLRKLIKITNNSIIGGSKLLHFCNPNKYAIYDTKVCSTIMKRKISPDRANNINYFINYIEKIIEWSTDKGFINDLKNILINKNQDVNKVSDLRCIEMCIYYSS